MIPKIIHYCWFGGKTLPESAVKCIASWKRFCPEYEIREWNESNFDISSNTYCQEAYEKKKWAFVADYVRLAVLSKYGGIYMDTDVEVVKPFDPLLQHSGFMCFETDKEVSIGTFGVEAVSGLVKDMLERYELRHFVKADGSLDTTTNLKIITKVLVEKYGLRLNGKKQLLEGNILVLPREAFIAKSYLTGWIMRTDATYAIHHYDGSWVDAAEKEKHQRVRKYMCRYLEKAEPVSQKMALIRIAYEDGGIAEIIKKGCKFMIRKLKSIGGGTGI